MLPKHVYMGWKFQRTLKLDIYFFLSWEEKIIRANGSSHFCNIRDKWKCVSSSICLWPVSCGVVFIYNISLMCKYLLELTKRSSKVQEKNTSRECALNFDHWKTFLRNYEPIRVWLWLVYKFTENNCHLQKPLENLKTIYHIHLKFSLWTKLAILLAKYICRCDFNSLNIMKVLVTLLGHYSHIHSTILASFLSWLITSSSLTGQVWLSYNIIQCGHAE